MSILTKKSKSTSWMHFFITVFLFAFICTENVIAFSKIDYLQTHDSLTISIDKLLRFYDNFGLFMNVDGIVGLQVLVGELQYLLSSSSFNNLPPSKQEILRNWQIKAKDLVNKILPIVRQRQSKYFNKVGHLVSQPVVPFGNGEPIYLKVDLELTWNKIEKGRQFDETASDQCMEELQEIMHISRTTTYSSFERLSNATRRPASYCTPSDQCLEQMLLSNGTARYTISHQVLYILFIKQFGCSDFVDTALSRNWNLDASLLSLERLFCSNMFAQLMEHWNAAGQVFHCDYRDLFTEFIFACGNLGFSQFLNLTFLEHILTWQHPQRGCFGDELWRKNSPQTERCSQKPLRDESPQYVTVAQPTLRKLHRDVNLPGGCSVHFSSVALSALSMYLRLFHDPFASPSRDSNVHHRWLKEFMQRRVKVHWPQVQQGPRVDDERVKPHSGVDAKVDRNIFAPSFVPLKFFRRWEAILRAL